MPDVDSKTPKRKPKTKELPRLDELKGILGWVETKKEETQESGKSWGWVVGLVVALIVFVAMAFAAYYMWKRGKEVARLKHKIDVYEELKEQAKARSKIQVKEIKRSELEKEAIDLQRSIDKTKKEIIKVEAERKKERTKIDKITSWEDVDKLLGK